MRRLPFRDSLFFLPNSEIYYFNKIIISQKIYLNLLLNI